MIFASKYCDIANAVNFLRENNCMKTMGKASPVTVLGKTLQGRVELIL